MLDFSQVFDADPMRKKSKNEVFLPEHFFLVDKIARGGEGCVYPFFPNFSYKKYTRNRNIFWRYEKLLLVPMPPSPKTCVRPCIA